MVVVVHVGSLGPGSVQINCSFLEERLQVRSPTVGLICCSSVVRTLPDASSCNSTVRRSGRRCSEDNGKGQTSGKCVSVGGLGERY